jgi:hypothetical protein
MYWIWGQETWLWSDVIRDDGSWRMAVYMINTWQTLTLSPRAGFCSRRYLVSRKSVTNILSIYYEITCSVHFN